MKFYVTNKWGVNFSQFAFQAPCVVLYDDNWDDYSFKTLFNAWLVVPHQNEPIDLGHVKILDKRLSGSGRTHLPDEFDALDENYCSLGQTLEYYRILAGVSSDLRERYVMSLRDCAFYDDIRDAFQEHKGFRVSLLRNSEANKCLKEGKSYAERTAEAQDIVFRYRTELPGCRDKTEIDFSFYPDSPLPSTTNVLIGRNGAGKTRLLASLASDIIDPRQADKFIPERPAISRVITVSYSAFDQFAQPRVNNRTGDENAVLLGYKYCGLRDEKGVIRDPSSLFVQLDDSYSRVMDKDRIGFVQPLLHRLFSDERADLFFEDTNHRREIYNGMSAGQKIVTTIIVQVADFVENESLVLMDEPETHLHPGLLWSFMISIDQILKATKSFSVVATHSPIILQQVPSKYVKVIRRSDDFSFVEPLRRESFGESIQTLMEEVFGFSEPEFDYRFVLKELAKTHTYEEILELFDWKLGFQAKIYLQALYTGE